MRCVICGCSDEQACFDEETEEVCIWVAENLCSSCEDEVWIGGTDAEDDERRIA